MSPFAKKNSNWFQSLKNKFLIAPTSSQELMQVLRAFCSGQLFDEDTLKMIEGVLAISKMQVKDIMIPRLQMASLSYDQSVNDLLKTITTASHSRFPVLGEDKDDVMGILLVKDFLRAYVVQGKNLNLKDLVRPAHFVPESKRLDSLLNEFKTSHNHLAIVVDEYGGIAGMVTIEDILEEIVGDIEDEFDIEEKPKIQKLAEQHYQVNAQASLEEVNEHLGSNFDQSEIDTIGGLVTLRLGHVPHAGNHLILGTWEVTVLKSDQRRVLMLEFKKRPS